MNSKKIHIVNLLNQKNKDFLENKKLYKNVNKRNNNFPSIIKKESEIQNNSIIDEDEYNEEIYNNNILSYKIALNEENGFLHSKSSFYSMERNKKNLYSLNCSRVNNKNNKNSNIVITKTIEDEQNSKNVDKDNTEFMNILNKFDEIHKKIIAKKIENNDKNKPKIYSNSSIKNKIISKFSKKKRKNNYLRSHFKYPSQSFNKINNEIKILSYTDTKSNLITRDKKLDINSNTRNLFSISQQKRNIKNKEKEISIKNAYIKSEISKDLIIEDNSNLNSSKYINYNNIKLNNSNSNSNSNLLYKYKKRVSKSMIDEEIHLKDYKNKNNDGRKDSPFALQRVVKKRNIFFEEEQNDKNKISSIKRTEYDTSKKDKVLYTSINLYNKETNKNDKNANSNKENSRNESINKRKFVYSNINSRVNDKEINDYRKNNDINNNKNIKNNNNSSSNFIYNNNRKHIINNYNVNSIKPYNKKPIINISSSVKNEKENKNQSLINNHTIVNIEQKKVYESLNIKIDKPSFHSRQRAGIVTTEHKKNIFTQSCSNLNHIPNLKTNSINTGYNEPENKRKYNYRRIYNIKQEKIDLFQNDLKLSLNDKTNEKQNNSVSRRVPRSNISSTKVDENSKNDEISSERSFITKFSFMNKNDGEKIIINTSRSQNFHNISNIDLNNKYTKNSLRSIVNYALQNTANHIENNNNNNNNNKTNQENKKVYIYEQTHHQYKYNKRNHNYHVIRSTSQDNNINIKDMSKILSNLNKN